MSRSSKVVFMDEAGIVERLQALEDDETMLTESSYMLIPMAESHLVSFQDKHLMYLRGHPQVNPEHYLANLRTMLKIRS